MLDDEIVAMHDGRPAFAALAGDPRTRSTGVVAYLAALDLLTEDERDHRALPYRERRVRPEKVIAGVRPPLQVVPSTTDREQALAWMQPQVSVVGIEGLNRRTPPRRTR